MSGFNISSSHCFPVRIWQEPDAVAALPQWRGSVKQLAEAKTHYFANLDELLTYIAQVNNGLDIQSITPGQK